MKYLIIPALAGTLFLGGCAELLRPTTPTISVVESKAAIVIKTQVQSGGFTTAADPRLTANSINHIVLSIFEVAGAAETPVRDAQGNPVTHDLTRANLGSLITFDKLKPQTTYRIRAAAYKAPGTDPGDLISTTDSGSYADVAVENDDRPLVTTLKVKLIDVVFDGQATFNGVTVTPGGYAPSGAVTITITPVEGDDDLLDEGSPAHQALLDDYRPVFENGMTWVYQVTRTHGDETTTGTRTVVVSNVTPTTLTRTSTFTPDDDPGNPEVVVLDDFAHEGWFPPATSLNEFQPYETFTLNDQLLTGVAKHGLNDNTDTDHAYLWIAHGIGVVRIQVTMPGDDETPIVETEVLTNFFTAPQD